jgi:hypothetical protein
MLPTVVLATLTTLGSIAGFGAMHSSRASASTEIIGALHASEASECASQAVGTVSDSFKLAACTDLDSDLVAIGKLLSLPVLAPTLVTSPVELEVSDSPDPNSPSAYMETQFFSAGLVSVEPCKVIIYPLALALDPGYQSETSVSAHLHVLLTHEAVHCYQNTIMSFDEQGGNDSTTIPQWISEGSATYIATLSIPSPEPATGSFWRNGWLGTPNKELVARSYDAVGWYSVVARATGNDLIGKFVAAWRAFVDSGYNNHAYIKALGGDVPAVQAAWAPSLLNAPQWGDAWATPGIGVPSDAQPTTVNDTIAAEDVPFSVQIAPSGAVVDEESTVTDGLVEISIDNGLASVHDLANTDELDFTDQVFCVGKACDDAEVTCQHPPSANAPDHITPIPLTVPFYVAAGGSDQAGTLTMENMSVPSDPSTPTQLPNGAGPCDPAGPKPPGPAGFSEGDPHLRTLNGGSYDFQGAGEYTLVRSASGGVDVQVRAQPFEGVTSSVAYNSAVAAKVGSSVVEVDAADPSVLRVNGKRVTTPIHGSRALGSGTNVGHLTESVDGSITDVVVTWPDGSELDVSSGELGIDATFVPPATPVDTYSGLLSALVLPKGNATDVVATPTVTLLGGDGHTYVLNPTTAAGFKALYGPFAQSWQITPTTSLFTYPKGKTTRSFDLTGFPRRVVTRSLLTPTERKKAKVACTAAGITGAGLLNDCIIDVGETGKKSFATATAREQAKASSPSTTTTTTPPRPPSGSTTTTTTTTPVGGSHPASYYFTHPCSVVTQSEIAQALGSVSAAPAASAAACTFRPNSSAAVDSVTFSSQSAGLFEGTHTGQSGSGPVPSLGHGAYCIVSPPYASGQSYVVAGLGAAGSIQVLAGNCTQGTALVKDALTRISGL